MSAPLPERLHTAWLSLAESSPLPWLVLTMLVYMAAMAIYRKSGNRPLLIPVFTGVVVIVAILMITGTPYATYRSGVSLLGLMIGPATVALAIPLYAQRERIRQLWLPISVALLVGCLVALLSALGIAWAFGGSQATLIAVTPKSATIPIALPMAERFGGTPSLAAVAVAITGISGTMMAPLLCRILRLRDPAVQGFAIGLTAHAIGTARAIQLNPAAGAFSALAMGLNGVATAVLMPLVLAITPWI
ncbi:LrgB family protein [Comamonas testosteroni]|uniref:LrgB family protein n=1 Tax=Comamonas testosteroni TaxID=285 RepID=UPI002DBDE58E|nr:LrgB family protein [Comamonas testosteroni]MEB5963994.1 LrgB family protein [Comamonas testosteroni]